MKLSPELLDIIVCPVSGDKLIYSYDKSMLISKKAGLAYPIVNGIPIVLASEAITLSPDIDPDLSIKEEKK